MSYEQRQNQARTDTTRHLNPNDTKDGMNGLTGYFEGARSRSARFAESTANLREIRAEIDSLGREAHTRPTGVLSGGDIDIAYHYLSLALGIVALLYSVLGAVFAFHGGSAAVLALILQQWQTGPAVAIADALFNVRTLMAIVLQAVLFIVLVGTRRNRQSWQHITALLASAALTYVGWNTLLVEYGSAPVAAFTAAIPAVLVGGAITWALVWGTSEAILPRPLMIGVIVAGVIAGAFGVSALIHWTGMLLAWSADQVARRVMVVG